MFWCQVTDCDILCVCYVLSCVYIRSPDGHRQPANATADSMRNHRLIMFEGTAAEKLERIAIARG